MRADEDVYLACFQVGEQFFRFFRTLEPAQVFDAHRQVLHAFAEGVIVLQRQHCGGYENGYLLAVCCYFECGTHRHFGLAETYVAADESVHRHRALEVAFDLCRRFRLIGRVFVEERRFQLVLHVAVGRVGKAFLLLAGRVQANQVARDVLHLVLGALFQPFPSAAAEPCYRRFRTLTTFVLADAVQVMDADEHVRPVAVVELDHLLRLAVHRRGDESSELGDAVVGMHDVIAYLQLVDLAQGDDGFAAARVLAGQRHAVEALEDLMIGVAADLQSPIHEPLVQRCVDRNEPNPCSVSVL